MTTDGGRTMGRGGFCGFWGADRETDGGFRTRDREARKEEKKEWKNVERKRGPAEGEKRT